MKKLPGLRAGCVCVCVWNFSKEVKLVPVANKPLQVLLTFQQYDSILDSPCVIVPQIVMQPFATMAERNVVIVSDLRCFHFRGSLITMIQQMRACSYIQ